MCLLILLLLIQAVGVVASIKTYIACQRTATILQEQAQRQYDAYLRKYGQPPY
jgi:hypothetical protein